MRGPRDRLSQPADLAQRPLQARRTDPGVQALAAEDQVGEIGAGPGLLNLGAGLREPRVLGDRLAAPAHLLTGPLRLAVLRWQALDV